LKQYEWFFLFQRYQIYQVDKIDAGKSPVLYTLKDLANDPVAGHFYRSQLLAAPAPEKGTYFRIEKIIKKKTVNKKKLCLVKYLHYPAVSENKVLRFVLLSLLLTFSEI
jgi:hypothetical protein